jgi:hypothetical protein
MSNSLGFGNRRQYNGTSVKIAEGVYVDRGIVRQVRAEYNTRMFKESAYEDEIALRMALEVKGLSFPKELYVGGRFKRVPVAPGKGSIDGWGSAFRVARIFDELHIEGKADENGRLDPNVVEQLLGRELYYLQYVSRVRNDGKVAYSDYNMLAAHQEDETEEETCHRLYALFTADVQKNFVKNFHPELLRESGTQGEFGFSAEVTNGVASTSPFD